MNYERSSLMKSITTSTTVQAGTLNGVPKYVTAKGTSRSLVISSGHYGYPDFPDNRAVGGPFLLTYSDWEYGSAGVGEIQGGKVYASTKYRGDIYATLGSVGSPVQVDGSAYGATAYNKMKPDKPSMQALNAIYELKDVPGMLQQRFLNHGLAGIGSYYLALKFGWEALLSDVRSFVLTQRKAQARLAQLIRDEGKPVRRSLQIASTSTSNAPSTSAGMAFEPALNSYFYDAATTKHAYVSNSHSEIWAKARFRYWLPGGPRDVDWNRRMLADIFGLKPTPSVVYKAIPWTWLLDWFTNVGDVINNLDTNIVDRLAADYSYVMRHDFTQASQTSMGDFIGSDTTPLYGHVPWSATATRTFGCKSRVSGDPFGFNTPANNLSGVQLSILGALGLSKLR